MYNLDFISHVASGRALLASMLVFIIILPMLLVTNRNRKRVKAILAETGIGEQLGSVKLTDADLMPILKIDGNEEADENNKDVILTEVAVKLQKFHFVGKLFSGIFVIMISVIMISIWGFGSITDDIYVLIFTVLVSHLIGQYIFVSRLLIPKNMSFSYGHAVPGKSFFAGNPLFGYKYFSYSKSLDKKFGLFNQKKDQDLK